MSVITRSKRRLSYSEANGDQAAAADPSCDPESVCALCKQSHMYMSAVHSWQSVQARNAVSEYGVTQSDTIVVHVGIIYVEFQQILISNLGGKKSEKKSVVLKIVLKYVL